METTIYADAMGKPQVSVRGNEAPENVAAKYLKVIEILEAERVKKAGEAEVDCIVLDAEHLHRYKERRYLIYIKGEGGIMLWKAVESSPVLLEFDCNF